jgi:hypothetical protein
MKIRSIVMTQDTYPYDGLVVKLLDAGADEPIKVLREGSDNKIRESSIPDLHDVNVSLFVLDRSPLDGKIATVDITLNPGMVTNREGRPPYSVYDDLDSDPNNIDFFGGPVSLGYNKIDFELNLKNGRQKTVTREFNILGVPDLKVGIFNAKTDTLITPLEDGDKVPASLLSGRRVTIAGYDADYEVESALLNFNYGDITRTENEPPYSLLGDINGDFNGSIGLIPKGKNNINFDLYSEDNLGGEFLGNVNINFKVIPDCGCYQHCLC